MSSKRITPPRAQRALSEEQEESVVNEIVDLLDAEFDERSPQARRIARAIADSFASVGGRITSRIFNAVGDRFDYGDAEMGYGL